VPCHGDVSGASIEGWTCGYDIITCLFVLAGGEAYRAGRDHGPSEVVAVAPGAAATRSRHRGIAICRHCSRGHQPVAGPGAIEPDSTSDRAAGNAICGGVHTAHQQQSPAPPPQPQSRRERWQQQHRVGASDPRRQTRSAASAQQDTGGEADIMSGAAQADVILPRKRRAAIPVVDQMQVRPIVAPQLGVHQQQQQQPQQEQRWVVHRQWRWWRQTAWQQTRFVAESPAPAQVSKGFGRWRRSVPDASPVAKQSLAPGRRCVVAVGGGWRGQRLQQDHVVGGRESSPAAAATTAGGRRYQQGTADQEIHQHA